MNLKETKWVFCSVIHGGSDKSHFSKTEKARTGAIDSWAGNGKPLRASPSYKIADCELSNSYLLTHKLFSSNSFF